MKLNFCSSGYLLILALVALPELCLATRNMGYFRYKGSMRKRDVVTVRSTLPAVATQTATVFVNEAGEPLSTVQPFTSSRVAAEAVNPNSGATAPSAVALPDPRNSTGMTGEFSDAELEGSSPTKTLSSPLIATSAAAPGSSANQCETVMTLTPLSELLSQLTSKIGNTGPFTPATSAAENLPTEAPPAQVTSEVLAKSPSAAVPSGAASLSINSSAGLASKASPIASPTGKPTPKLPGAATSAVATTRAAAGAQNSSQPAVAKSTQKGSANAAPSIKPATSKAPSSVESSAPTPSLASSNTASAEASSKASSTVSSATPSSAPPVEGSSLPLVSKRKNLKGYGIAYSPYAASGRCKSQNEVESDIGKLSGYTYVRLYGADCDQTRLVVPAAAKNNMKTFVAVYNLQNRVKGDGGNNFDDELNLIIAYGRENGWDDINTVAIGNEDLNTNRVTGDEVVGRLREARERLRNAGYEGPVVHVDTLNGFLQNPKVCSESDYLAANLHPWFSGVSADQSGEFIRKEAETLLNACGNKDIMIAETGWPHDGVTHNKAVASKQDQKVAIDSIKRYFPEGVVLFSAFDDKWKSDNAETFGAEKFWGMMFD